MAGILGFSSIGLYTVSVFKMWTYDEYYTLYFLFL